MTNLPVRKPNRLQNYDYSQNGAYFVTVCAKDHKELFGNVVGAAFCRPHVELSKIGQTIKEETKILQSTYDMVVVDLFVIMPNHVHMIIVINNSGRQNAAPTVSRIINQWKRAISRKTGTSLWQKSFYDHIIRDEDDYCRIWEYIENNPANWFSDCYYKKEII